MRKPTKDDDRPIGRLTIVRDFLPPPEELVVPEDTIKVTILLDRRSVEFFKSKAKESRTKYQRMMREVLKRYAAQHSHPKAA